MSDTPPSGLPPAAPSPGPTPTAGPTGFSPISGSANSLPLGSGRPQRASFSVALVSLVVALVAVGFAVAAWLRPVPTAGSSPMSAPAYSDQQIADAKGNVCEAYRLAKHALVVSTHKPDPVAGDESGSLAAAANGRLAVLASAYYLQYRLAEEPAAPVALATAIRSLTSSLMKFGIQALGDQPSSALDPLRHAMDSESANIDRLCE